MHEEINAKNVKYITNQKAEIQELEPLTHNEVGIESISVKECDPRLDDVIGQATKLNGRSQDGFDKNKNPMYTLITGASSGIGKALALECASKGMNILLVALPGEELSILEKQIQERYKIKCHSFGTDLSVHCSSSAVYEWTKRHDYKVNILINNVGVGSKGSFDQISPDFYYTQIHLNVMTTCIMTRLFINDLKANAPAHIMNVGSMGGFFMLPDKIVYSATKAFVYAFSQGLRMELAPSGVTVSVLCPGGTDSNEKTTAINKDLKGLAKRSILQPDEVAKEAIDKMLKGRARIIPGFINKVSYHISRIVPEFVHRLLISRAFSHVKKHQYSS